MSEEFELNRLDDDGAPHPPIHRALLHSDAISDPVKEVTQEYWTAFEENFRDRLQLLHWTPFHVLKTFKVGLHWVTVYRPVADGHFHYWVTAKWQAAVRVADETAATLRKEFEQFYARPI